MRKKIRVLHALSILQESPILLPVPPVAGCAPCWNIYRLHEALQSENISAEVISPCTHDQLEQLHTIPQTTTYKWIDFSNMERRFSDWLQSLNQSRSHAAMRRLAGANTWLSYRYLKRIVRYYKQHDFDMLILDDAPQNLNYLRKFIPREELAFFCRGDMGMSRRYLNSVSVIFTTNDLLAQHIETIIPRGDAHPAIRIVPNSLGMEFMRVQPHRFGLRPESEHVRIIFVGRIVPGKGVVELVEAFKRVHAHNSDATLTIIGGSGIGGDQTSDYATSVHDIASDLPPGVIHFLGAVPYEEIASHYLSADIAVFPSVGVEGFGMVAIEAMRCGIPVIVSRQAGFESFIRDSENGVIVSDPRDSVALAAAVLDLIADPARAEKLARAGYETSLQYTPDNAARAFEAAIIASVEGSI